MADPFDIAATPTLPDVPDAVRQRADRCLLGLISGAPGPEFLSAVAAGY
jgi:hypothetical protein